MSVCSRIAIAVLLTSVFSTTVWGQGDALKRFGPKALKFAVDQAAKSRQPPPPPPGAIAVRAVPTVTQDDYVTQTSDGWKLVVHRYYLPGMPAVSPLPVILCHGFGYNAQFFDLRADVSFANYLASSGFDVWAVDLRGCGMSHKWALTSNKGGEALVGRLTQKLTRAAIPAGGFVSIEPKYYQWDLDDCVDRDIPAVLSLVKHHTKAAQVAWVGHSMGGNIMLAYLAKYGQDPAIGRVITVGSQVTMPDGQLFIQFLGELVRQRQAQLSGQPITSEELFTSMNGLFFNEQNTDPAIAQMLNTRCHDTPSLGLIRQYNDLSQGGRLVSADRKTVYADAVNRITCPFLVVGGGVDQVAPPRVQKHLYDHLGSQDRTLLILGRHTGLASDYGHNDSFVGFRAAQEVYPLLAQWLVGQPLGR